MSTAPSPDISDAIIVWLDGELLRGATVNLHGLTHALHYGSSIFEGVRLYPTPRGPAIFRLREHVARMYEGAGVYGMRIPYTQEQTCEFIVQTAAASKRESAYIRPLVFFGGDTVRLAPEDACETRMLIAVLPFAGLKPGMVQFSAGLTSVMKTPSAALPSHVKAGGHYTNSIRALQDVQARGFDEAILQNDRGEVAEGSGENVFVVRDGVLITNDAKADILPGITRDSVLTLAREAGIPIDIRPLHVTDLQQADEAFFTGTAAEVVPIIRFEDRTLAEGPIGARLRTRYAAIVRGQEPAPGDWLTYLR
jgi:branched-chain amino acid aminotransferase